MKASSLRRWLLRATSEFTNEQQNSKDKRWVPKFCSPCHYWPQPCHFV